MSVWFAIPSARPVAEASACFAAWRAIGCRVAATRKAPLDWGRLGLDLCLSLPRYLGWPSMINRLAKEVLARDPDCSIVVTGGDDVFPDQDFPAERVEREFVEHFGGTLGVMQPTGLIPGTVPWSKGIIDGKRVQERIAWAPWMGRGWCERAYGGVGPMWPEYGHYFADEHLQLTATRLGLFWQRPDIHQDHRTWKQDGGKRPEHLQKAQLNWDRDKALFDQIKAADWPCAGLQP